MLHGVCAKLIKSWLHKVALVWASKNCITCILPFQKSFSAQCFIALYQEKSDISQPYFCFL